MKITIDQAIQRLEQQPGIIAVFTATTRDGISMVTEWKSCTRWKTIVLCALNIHIDAHLADLVVSIDGGQTVRVMGDRASEVAVVVVHMQDTPFGKSLPRSMRRLLEMVLEEKSKADASSVVAT